jgi:hypothetical protein
VLALRFHPHGRHGPYRAGSVDLIPRRQPDRAAVSTKNSNARLVVTEVWETRTVARASATEPWKQRAHVLDDGLLPPGACPRASPVGLSGR